MVGRLLLVDDDEAVLGIAMEYLRRVGFDVRGAVSAREARAAMEEVPEGFDAVVIDWTLPDLSGRELVNAVRSAHPQTAILISTGHGQTVVGDQLVDSGVASILRKPYPMRNLRKAIEDALAKTRPDRPVPGI